ncbi:MAG: hypothetical protein ACK2UM_09120 [Anaerolineales bacterium]|jgi:cobalamin biosynthesis protein CobD/CbiB
MNYNCSAFLTLVLLAAPAVLLFVYLLVRYVQMIRKSQNDIDQRDPRGLIGGLLIVAILGFITFVIYALTANRPC